LVNAQCFQGGLYPDLFLFKFMTFLLKCHTDIFGRHSPVKLVAFSCLDFQRNLQVPKLFRFLFSCFFFFCLTGGAAGFLFLKKCLIRSGCRHGQILRDEKIPSKAVAHAYHIPFFTDILDIFQKQ